MRFGRTSIRIMIGACSLFALGLTACGGDGDGGTPPEIKLPIDTNTATHIYEITSDPTMTGNCAFIYDFLKCDSPTTCMDKMGVGRTGEMEIEYSDSTVSIEIVNSLTSFLPVPLVFNGTRTATSFTALFTPYSPPLPGCVATVNATLTGGDVSSAAFSGNLNARLTVSCLNIPVCDCAIGTSYDTQQAIATVSGLTTSREFRNSENILQPMTAEDEIDQVELIIRALFLIE